MRNTLVIVMVGLAAVVISGAIWLSNYNECRSHGFSVLYCVTRR